jgi:hypothetical protein
MALIRNGVRVSSDVRTRPLGGGLIPGCRTVWGRSEIRNRLVGGFDAVVGGMPSGHLAPSSWMLPLKAGAISAYVADLSITNNAPTLIAGRNLSGDTTLAFTDVSGTLGLIVSATGTATVSFTADGDLAGSLSGSGTSSITFSSPTALLGALVGGVGTASLTLSGAAAARAVGHLAGDIVPFTELSPQSLADAVWSAIASANNSPGTMGELLNNSGAGSNPWTVQLEGSYTAADLMRIIAAVAAGKTSGQPSAPVFRSVDDSANRVAGTVDGSGNRTSVTVTP